MGNFTNEERMKYIGGSDAAAVLGLSRWKTPLQCWAEKTGQIVPDDISGRLSVKLGNILEDTVCTLFEEQTGLKTVRRNESYVHPQHPFIVGRIDRKIVGKDWFLEAKTCSPYKAKEWDGEEIPQEYIIQCYHYLAVTGFKKCYIAVLIGNQDFKVKEIAYDEKIINDIISKEVSFWNDFVIPKVMPMTVTAKDDDTLFKLFPNAKEGTEIALPDEVNQIIEQIDAFSADKKTVETNLKRLQNELKARIQDNEIGNTGIYKIKWLNVHKDAYTCKEQNYRMIKYSKIKEDK